MVLNSTTEVNDNNVKSDYSMFLQDQIKRVNETQKENCQFTLNFFQRINQMTLF